MMRYEAACGRLFVMIRLVDLAANVRGAQGRWYDAPAAACLEWFNSLQPLGNEVGVLAYGGWAVRPVPT